MSKLYSYMEIKRNIQISISFLQIIVYSIHHVFLSYTRIIYGSDSMHNAYSHWCSLSDAMVCVCVSTSHLGWDPGQDRLSPPTLCLFHITVINRPPPPTSSSLHPLLSTDTQTHTVHNYGPHSNTHETKRNVWFRRISLRCAVICLHLLPSTLRNQNRSLLWQIFKLPPSAVDVIDCVFQFTTFTHVTSPFPHQLPFCLYQFYSNSYFFFYFAFSGPLCDLALNKIFDCEITF